MAKISKIGDPNDIMASFCAKMFIEAQAIDMAGFDILYRDLFSEQGNYISLYLLLSMCLNVPMIYPPQC